MTAPNYSKQRSQLAREWGLGRKAGADAPHVFRGIRSSSKREHRHSILWLMRIRSLCPTPVSDTPIIVHWEREAYSRRSTARPSSVIHA
jgi:hypothetical protein